MTAPDAAPEAAASLLARLSGNTDELPVADAALAFAALARPGLDVVPYRAILADLAGQVAAVAPDDADLEAANNALRVVLTERAGFTGDTETYDDLDNADLARVIDRRRGLPVTLGILWMATARAQGWRMVGLAFPGHFLVRLEVAGERVIVDPFAGGLVCDAARLRLLLKAMTGEAGKLGAEHYAAVSDRDVLLRLQNNIRLRLTQSGELPRALGVVESMLLLAGDEAGLWREAALLNATLERLGQAVACLETGLTRTTDPLERRRIMTLLEQMRGRLN
ncbi:MAG TPA: transglutaminase-like domain-containing protein [Stellaceae bacterium]|nr:transglutaminase-like domain-containing protein [Stellaceae bacterium]